MTNNNINADQVVKERGLLHVIFNRKTRVIPVKGCKSDRIKFEFSLKEISGYHDGVTCIPSQTLVDMKSNVTFKDDLIVFPGITLKRIGYDPYKDVAVCELHKIHDDIEVEDESE